MKIKSEKDFWSGLMFMVLGIAFAWGSTDYKMGTSAQPGPGYLPLGMAVVMAILGGVLLFKSLTFEVEGGDPIASWAWRPLLVVIGAVFVVGWTLPHLGLFIALPLLVMSSAAAGNEFRIKDAIVSSALLTVLSWLIFVWGLKLTIPLMPAFLAR